MADNVVTQTTTLATVPTATRIATREVTYSGDANAHIAPTVLVGLSGSEGSFTATDVAAGGGVEAAALRVTIASDSTGVVSVDDNGATLSVDDGGGSLTVDGTVGVSGTVAVTDNSGSLTVDAPVGTPVFVRLSDGASAITTLPVSLASVPSHAVTNAGTFAVQVDGAALTALQLIDNPVATTGSAIPSQGFAVSGTDGTNARVLRTDTNGELQVDVLSMPTTTVTATNLSTNVAQMNGVAVTMGNGASGTGVQRVTLASDSTGNIATIGTSVTPGTGATNLGKAEDAAHTTGDVGVMMLGVRQDTAASLAGTTGDYVPPQFTATGAMRVALSEDENATAYHSSLVRGVASITDGSSTQVLAAAGASVRNYVTGVSIANTSASTVTVDLRDGTAGAVMWTFIAPAGGGVVFDFSSPLRGTANTAVAADPSASASTITVSISGYTAA